MESHNPQKTKNIIKDITTTELSSYQIAYKYNTTRATIGKLGKAHLGDNIFRKKEELAMEKLCSQIREYQAQNMSVAKIAETLGIARSTMFRIIERLPKHEAPEDKDETVKIISIEHPEKNLIEERAAPLPSPLANKGFHEQREYHSGYYRRAGRKSYPHRRYAKIELKGIQILFDEELDNVAETISKILNILQN